MSFIPGDFHIGLSQLRSVLTVPAITVAIAPPGCSRIPSDPKCAEHSSPQCLQFPLPRVYVLEGIPFVHAAAPSPYPSSRFQTAQHSGCLDALWGSLDNLVDGGTEQSANNAALEAQDSGDMLRVGVTGERGKRLLNMLPW